jgi:hypothetical protein
LKHRLFIDNNDGTTLNDVLEDKEKKKKDSVAVNIETNFVIETVDKTVNEVEAMVVEEDIRKLINKVIMDAEKCPIITPDYDIKTKRLRNRVPAKVLVITHDAEF